VGVYSRRIFNLTQDPGAESILSIGSLSDFIDNDHDGNVDENAPEVINTVSDAPGAINVYFNKAAFDSYASSESNKANYRVNLEQRLIKRINEATATIDIAIYEINLQDIVSALVNRASNGIDVRVIADAKSDSDPAHAERYTTMRLHLEKLARGLDNQIGTSDDVHLFSDSAIFAVEDSAKRIEFGLPESPNDIPEVELIISKKPHTGRMLVDGEQKSDGSYLSPSNQQHNKFAIIDSKWVWTGSWNWTITGLYGTESNKDAGILGGNQQHSVEIHSSELAAIYTDEFNEMWGSTSLAPDPGNSDFHNRKRDNTAHEVWVNNKKIEVYFSAGDNALGKLRNYVANEANHSAYFEIFAWSDQNLVNELKYLWEGSYVDIVGTLTGFDVKGIFDSSFWNSWWSASVEMTGRVSTRVSEKNPNIRWANPAPVYKSNEDRKLHAKTMIIDVNTSSDPTVIIGSTNWSDNGNDINDENMLFIHDADIANQFYQEFNARLYSASRVAPVDVKEETPATDTISIASFNIQFLGNSTRRDDAALAAILKDYDIVVVQELVSPPYAGNFPDGTPLKPDAESAEFFDEMIALGFQYSLSEEDTGTGDTIHKNGSATEWWVAFFKPEVVEIATDLPSGFLAEDRSNHDDYERVPYAFPFRTINGNMDFVLISVHLKPGSSSSDKARRQQELSAISYWIDANNQFEKDLIVLGDMNLYNQTEVTNVLPPNYISLNQQCVATNTNINSPQPYDHVMYHPSLTSEVINELEVIYLLDVMRSFWTGDNYPGEPYDHNAFRAYYSDHHPIVFQMTAQKDDD